MCFFNLSSMHRLPPLPVFAPPLRAVAGNTPLHLACDRGLVGNVKLLLEWGADAEAKNEAGAVPAEVGCRLYVAFSRHHFCVLPLAPCGWCAHVYNSIAGTAVPVVV